MSSKDFDPSTVELNGYLQKRGGSSLSRWKNRWFSVQKNKLCYFRSKEDDEPIGYIPLHKINYVYSSSDIASVPSKLQGCAFVIDTGKKSYFMLANERQEMWAWVDGLEKLRKYWSQHGRGEALTRQASAPRATNLPIAPSSGKIEGHLLKKGPSNLTGFKPRYFVLNDEYLSYYKTSENEEMIRQIHILSINYVTPTNNIPGLSKRHYGLAFLIDAENHILYLVAPSKDNMWLWVNSITSLKKKIIRTGGSTQLRDSLSVSVKKTPRKNFEKLAQMIMSSDHLLVGALCEVVRDRLPVSTALYSLYLCQGKVAELLKWAAIHHIAVADTKTNLQLWEPMREKVTVAVVARYIYEHDNALIARFSSLMIHALEQLGDQSPDPKSIIKMLVDLMLVSWGQASWPSQQVITQYRVALSLKFIVSETDALTMTLLYLLHILLSPTYPAFNFLEDHGKGTSSSMSAPLSSMGHLTPAFETISNFLATSQDSENLNLYEILREIVTDNHEAILQTTSVTSNIQGSNPRTSSSDMAEVEKQALGLLHHQLSVNVDALGDLITQRKNMYDFMDVEIEHVDMVKEEEVVIIQKQQQEVVEEIEYEVLMNPSMELNSISLDDVEQQLAKTKIHQDQHVVCIRPSCSCHKYEPHPFIVDKCDNCFHTKSEHDSKGDLSRQIVPKVHRKIVSSLETEDNKVGDVVASRETIQDIHEEVTEEVVSVDVHEEFEEIEEVEKEDSNEEPRRLENPFKEAFALVDQLFIVLALCDVDWLRERNYGQLVKILGSAEFATVAALYQVTKDTDRVAKAVVSLFDARLASIKEDKLAKKPALHIIFNRLKKWLHTCHSLKFYSGLSLTLLKWAISKEVQTTASESILFRTDSLATKLWKAYTTTVGLNYIRSTLRPCVSELLQNPQGHEVDPGRVQATENPVENMTRLLETCNKFYSSFKESIESCPIILRLVCRHLFHEVAARFPGSEYAAVGGFVFLRYLCGGIMTPEKYGIFEGEISPLGRRALILVAKILQNLNNAVEFDGVKEAYMMGANAFIQEKMSDLKMIYDGLAATSEDVRIPLAVPSRSTFVSAQLDLEFLHSEIGFHLDDISAKLAGLVSNIERTAQHQKKVRIRTTRKIKTITKLETTKRITQVLKPIVKLEPAVSQVAVAFSQDTAIDTSVVSMIEQNPDAQDENPASEMIHGDKEALELPSSQQSGDLDVAEGDQVHEINTKSNLNLHDVDDHAKEGEIPVVEHDQQASVGEASKNEKEISDLPNPMERMIGSELQTEVDQPVMISTGEKDQMEQDQSVTTRGSQELPSISSHDDVLDIVSPVTKEIRADVNTTRDRPHPFLKSTTTSAISRPETVDSTSRLRSVSRVSVVRKGFGTIGYGQYHTAQLKRSPVASGNRDEFNPFQQKQVVPKDQYSRCKVEGCVCTEPELHVWMRNKCKNCFHGMEMHRIGCDEQQILEKTD